jgi:putative ABC transport system substrate-binding protein
MDNTVASGASLVIQKAKYYKIPVLSSYLEAVKLGALAAVAYDEYQVGVETADLAIEIIKNNFTQIPPVKFANQKIKLIKRQVAEQFLITLNYEELQRKKYSVE